MTVTWYEFAEEPVYGTSPSGYVKAAAHARATVTDVDGAPLPIRQDGVEVPYAEADATGYLRYETTEPVALRTIGARTARRVSLQLEASAAGGAEALAELDALAPVGIGGQRLVVPAGIPDLSGEYARALLNGKLPVRQGDFVVNADDYGPRNAVTVQAAFDAVAAAGGGTVILAPGSWVLETTPRVAANTRILAYGAHITNTSAQLALLYNYPAGNQPSAYTGNGNMVVEGGVWDMRAHQQTTARNCMTFAHCQGVTLRNVTIRNVSSFHALELHSVQTARVIDCRFEGFTDNTGDNSRQYSEAVQLDLTGLAGDDNTPCRDVVVAGCYFGPSDVCGPWGRAVGSHTIGTTPHDGIRIVNCHVDGTLQEGIRAYSWSNAVFAGNYLTTGRAAILAQAAAGLSAANLIIERNIVDGTTDVANGTGIQVGSLDGGTSRYSNVVIAGNVVRNTASTSLYAIAAEFVHNVLVRGNRVTSPAAGGIYAGRGDNPSIVGNVVVTPAGVGIVAEGASAGSTGGVIEANEIVSPGGYGIQASNIGGILTDVSILGNVIRNPLGNAAIRLSNGSQRMFVAGNRVLAVAAPSATAAVAVYAGTSGGDPATSGAIVGNYFAGQGWAANTAAHASGAWIYTLGGNQTWPGAVIAYGGPVVAWSTSTGFNAQGSNMVTAP